MVFGDSHYKTFDGKMYRFQGSGKYQLVSDCRGHIFTIRVASEYKRNFSVLTKRVSIKIGDTRLNLGQKNRIKVNGKRIRELPFKKEGRLRIEKTAEYTHVVLFNGVKILWSGKSFLEITVPITYKGKLCGLCGNFNSNVQDDLKMRKGPVVNDSQIFQFGSSWCVGRNCPKRKPKQCKVRGRYPIGKNLCKYLTSTELFNGCDSKLNYSQYFKACLMDMCDCPSGKCYCESLTAYAQDCQRLGVNVHHWKRNSYCTGDHFRKPKPTRSPFSKSQIERILKERKGTKAAITPIPIN